MALRASFFTVRSLIGAMHIPGLICSDIPGSIFFQILSGLPLGLFGILGVSIRMLVTVQFMFRRAISQR